MFTSRMFGGRGGTPPPSAEFARQELGALAPLPALAYLAEWLPQDESVYEDAASLLATLAAIDPVCRRQYDAAVTELLDGPVTPLRARLFGQSALPFVDALVSAHRRGLEAYLTSSASDLPPHAGLIGWWTERMLVNFAATRQTAADDWADLHMTAAALLGGTLPAAGRSAAKLAMARLALAGVGLSAEFSARQAYILARLSDWCAPFVSLLPAPEGRLCYVLDLAANAPPARCRRDATAAELDGRLFADLDQVITELGQLEQFVLQYARLPKKLSEGVLEAPEVLATLRRLRDRWCGRPHTRRYRRHPLGLAVDVAADFAGIRDQLPGGARPDPALPNPDLVRGRVVDVSQGGSGLVMASQDWARVGAAVGLHVVDSRNWMLGVVRRAESSDEDIMMLGVDVLALKPQSVRLAESASQDAESEVLAIWIPPSSHSRRQSLLWVEHAEALQVGKTYVMYVNGSQASVRVAELNDVGLNFVSFRVDSAEHPDEAGAVH